MSLCYAVLAGLANSPKTGYDLTKGFQGSIGFFWNATHQQIYRELERVRQQGWVSMEVEPQEGKPDRKLYSITSSGRDELRRWIESPTESGPSREPLLVKLFVGHLSDPRKLIADLERQRLEHEATLVEYRKVEAQYFKDVRQLQTNRKFQRFTLRYGITYEEGWLAWCEEVMEELHEISGGNTGIKSNRRSKRGGGQAR